MRSTARIFAACLAGMTVLLTTACSSQEDGFQFDIQETLEEETNEFETIVPVEETVNTESKHNAAANTAAVHDVIDANPVFGFRSAVWLCRDVTSETERYLIFYDDNNGKIVDQETGNAIGFTCELGLTDGVFHLGGADNQSPVTISWTTQDSLVLTWNDGKKEIVSFLREDGSKDLQFLSNQQLCALCLNDYEQKTGSRPAHAEAMTNQNMTVSVYLYNEEGGQKNTCDWYTIDRYTGTGYNLTNEKITLDTENMPEFVPETTVTTEPAPTTAAPTEPAAPTEIPVEEVPAEEPPVAEVPAEEPPVAEAPAEEAPAEEIPPEG